MKLEIGQTWVSQLNPHESFRIYNGVVDTCVDSFKDETIPFDEQPETTKIFFWERADRLAFDQFVKGKKGKNYENSFPYAWCGECKKSSLVSKIKNNEMVLLDD